MEQYRVDDLLIFARVAEAGSFSRAAELLNQPKSSVSRRIAILEEQLGERLMLRTTRRLTLTEYGQALLEHARQIVDEVDAVTALTQQRQTRPSGLLRVSMPGDFASYFLIEMLSEFIGNYPEITLELDLTPRRVDLIGEGFDLAIRMGDLPDDATLSARILSRLPVSLYASPAYLETHGTPSAPDALNGHCALRLLNRGGEPLPWNLYRGEVHQEINPSGHVLANSPELLIRLACAGKGITAVTDYFAAPFLETGQLQVVLPDWHLPPVSCWAVLPGRRLTPAKTRAFLALLEARLSLHLL